MPEDVKRCNESRSSEEKERRVGVETEAGED